MFVNGRRNNGSSVWMFLTGPQGFLLVTVLWDKGVCDISITAFSNCFGKKDRMDKYGLKIDDAARLTC